jgi:uncharacterized glyoxalase superfamily protein PhnB
MKPVDLVRKLRRDAAFEPGALDRGKGALMTTIRQEVQPTRRPAIIPQLPYADIRAALTFLERAFGFREIATSRMEGADGVIHHSLVEFGGGVIGIGTQGAHGAVSPQRGGVESQYISVGVADVLAHYQRALAAGARIAKAPRDHAAGGARAYEAFDPEGHRWRFIDQRLREVPAKA